MICAECRYWCETKRSEGTGECRRRAPPTKSFRSDAMDREYDWFRDWPLTGSNDWCGEFRKR